MLSTRGLGCGRFCFSSNIYEQGWHNSESTRLPQIHQCDPGLNPGVEAICGLSLLLVLSLAPRGFSLGTPVIPFL